MKAVIYEEYGPPEVLQVVDIPKPSPQPNEILIKVHATSVETGDVNMRGFNFVPPGFGFLPRLMFGISKPKEQILGTVVSGEVAKVGNEVKEFEVGDRVYGIGSTSGSDGAYAEFCCREASGIVTKIPDGVSYKEAAAIPFGAITALYFLQDKGGIKEGDDVMVRGASGGVGVYAVQLAKHFGAKVTGVSSTKNIDLIKSLGADKVIDYKQEDIFEIEDRFDLIIDTVVGKNSFSDFKPLLKPNGRYLSVAGGPRVFLQIFTSKLYGSKKAIAGTPPDRLDELNFLTTLLANGLIKPVIDKEYSLDEIVDAHTYVDTGRKRGCVIINVT